MAGVGAWPPLLTATREGVHCPEAGKRYPAARRPLFQSSMLGRSCAERTRGWSQKQSATLCHGSRKPEARSQKPSRRSMGAERSMAVTPSQSTPVRPSQCHEERGIQCGCKSSTRWQGCSMPNEASDGSWLERAGLSDMQRLDTTSPKSVATPAWPACFQRCGSPRIQ